MIYTMEGLGSIVSGLKNIIKFIKFFIRIINQLLNNTTRVIKYVLAIVPKIYAYILTMPAFLQIFATITIGVSVAYLLLGREHGKSD